MTTSHFLTVKPLSMNTTRSTSFEDIFPRVIEHNARSNPDEVMACAIDSSRTHLNRIMAGPATPEKATELAWQLIGSSSRKLRANASIGIEVVISLPRHLEHVGNDLFPAALEWCREFFRVPVIRADFHDDEAQPHLHVVMLALRDGKIGSSEILGGRHETKLMHQSFSECVGERYGLRLPRKRRETQSSRMRSASDIIDAIRADPALLDDRHVHGALMEAIATKPEMLREVLQLHGPIKKPKAATFAGIFTSKVKPDRLDRGH